MSEIKVNKVSPRTNCGTVQLGDSGDTITIPAGATITNAGTANGFGATGAVNWQTTIKTGDFTAVSGEGYFVNTSSGAVSVTLPSSPSAGDIVAVSDYAKTFDTNNCTLLRNGSNISGAAENSIIGTEGISLTLVYADATKGWIVTDSGLQSESPGAEFIAATGGTVTTVCTNFKVHTFTGPGTFQVTNAGNTGGSNKVSYLVVAGGGGSGQYYGGAGGGGGFRESKSPDTPYTASPLDETNGLSVCATSYPITVGAGGTNRGGAQPGLNGSNSVFSIITSAGGGFGGGGNPGPAAGGPGGSGGGGGSTNGGAGGSGNTPPTNPPQGKDGKTSGGALAGGGGGATVAGGTNPDGKQGGTGATTSITNSPVAYAGGGGGGPTGSGCTGTSPCGSGGINTTSCSSTNGLTNRGGGGGADGGDGGSGIVVIRYKFQ